MEDNRIIERIKSLIDWLIFNKAIKNRRELAEKLGYTESSLSQILNEKVNLPEKFIKKLSDIDENIKIDWIFKGEGEMIIKNKLLETRIDYISNNNQTEYLLKIINNLEYTITIQKELIEELKKKNKTI